MNQPITVTNTINVDHWALGHEFARWDSEQQAQFLHGMHHGFIDILGELSTGAQLLMVADYAKDNGIERDLEEVATTLYSYLGLKEGA